MKFVNLYFGVLLRYFLVFILTALTFNYFIQERFGQSDLLLMIFWGIPAILINSAIISFIIQITKKTNLIICFCIRIVVAVIISYFGVYCYIFFLGAWFGALSIPPFPSLLSGAFAGSFQIKSQSKDRIRTFILNLCVYVLIIFFFGVGLFHLNLFVNTKIREGGKIVVVSAIKTEKTFNNEQEIKNYYCPEAKQRSKYFSFCSPDDLKLFIDLYNSKKIVFHVAGVSHKLNHYKKRKASVFLVFSDNYKLSTEREFLKIPQSGSILYFHDGTSWIFFPKEMKFSKQRMEISYFTLDGEPRLCLSVEDVTGHSSGRECSFASFLNNKIKLR